MDGVVRVEFRAPKAGGLLKTSLLFPVSPLKQNNLVVIAPCGWPCADAPICLLGGHKSRHNRDRTLYLEVSDLRSNQAPVLQAIFLSMSASGSEIPSVKLALVGGGLENRCDLELFAGCAVRGTCDFDIATTSQ